MFKNDDLHTNNEFSYTDKSGINKRVVLKKNRVFSDLGGIIISTDEEHCREISTSNFIAIREILNYANLLDQILKTSYVSDVLSECEDTNEYSNVFEKFKIKHPTWYYLGKSLETIEAEYHATYFNFGVQEDRIREDFYQAAKRNTPFRQDIKVTPEALTDGGKADDVKSTTQGNIRRGAG